MRRGRYLVPLAVAAVLAGCSSDEASAPAPPPPAPVAAAAAPPPPPPPPAQSRGADARFSGRAARVYDAYYAHCREFTPAALAWPGTATGAEDAARQFAGPRRQFQPPAFRGCLAGLRVSTGRVTVAELERLAAEEEEEHGDG